MVMLKIFDGLAEFSIVFCSGWWYLNLQFEVLGFWKSKTLPVERSFCLLANIDYNGDDDEEEKCYLWCG